MFLSVGGQKHLVLWPSISYVETHKHEIFNQSVPPSTTACAHAKFQWQNLLSLVAHHAISVCSSAFVFVKQKLGSKLNTNLETDVQKRRRKRTKREGLSED